MTELGQPTQHQEPAAGVPRRHELLPDRRPPEVSHRQPGRPRAERLQPGELPARRGRIIELLLPQQPYRQEAVNGP